MPVTVEDIRRTFGTRIARTNDRMDQLRRDLMAMDVQSRIAVLEQYGIDEFIRQWSDRVEEKRSQGHYPSGHSPEQAWRAYGSRYMNMFADGDQRILRPLQGFQQSRDAARSRAAHQAGDAERRSLTPRWKRWWEGYYSGSFVNPSGVRRPEASLARWLIFRWDRLAALAQPLYSAGFQPNLTNQSANFVYSFLVLTGTDQAQRDGGLVAGQTYFNEILGRYCTGLNLLANSVVQYVYDYPTPLNPTDRANFERLCQNWNTLNQNPGNPPGFSPGLPYSHGQRIGYLYNCFNTKRQGGTPSDMLRQQAGIVIQRMGGLHIYPNRWANPCTGHAPAPVLPHHF